MITYLLQVSFCWLFFYGIYHFVLKRETFFSINRGYLLSTLLLSLFIPQIGTFFQEFLNTSPEDLSVVMYHFSETPYYISSALESTDKASTTNWIKVILGIVYFLGITITGSKFLHGLFRIGRLYRQGNKTKKEGFTLVQTHREHLPFSFFKYVFLSDKIQLNKKIDFIIHHEITHVKSLHSVDILLVEILHVLFWFNPVLIFYKKALRHTHEYQADASVLKTSTIKNYGQILLGQSSSGLEVALANHFFNSQIKNRITMMYQKKSGKPALIKYLAALPVLFLTLVLFSSSKMVEETPLDNSFLDFNKGKTELIEVPMDFTAIDSIPLKRKEIRPIDKSFQQRGDDEIFTVAQVMPRFPGCEDLDASDKDKDNCAKGEMLKFIYKNLSYPAEARKNGVQGMCVVQFVINKDGSISGAKLVRDIGAGCGDAALNVVHKMNDLPKKWVPGFQNGNPVNVLYTIPVRFKLEGDEKEQVIEEEISSSTRTIFKKKQDEPNKIESQTIVVDMDYGMRYFKKGKTEQSQSWIFVKDACNHLKIECMDCSTTKPHITFYNKFGEVVFEKEEYDNNIQELKNSLGYDTYVYTMDYGDYNVKGNFKVVNELEIVEEEEIEKPLDITPFDDKHIKITADKIVVVGFDESSHQIKGDNIKLNSSNSKTKPLIVLNDKIQDVSVENLEINPDDIESVNVLKDKSATDKYGEKAKDGVIEVYTKNYAKENDIITEKKQPVIVEEVEKPLSSDKPDPLYILEEKKINKVIMECIDPSNIKNINVLKGEKAMSAYSEGSENGVIEIFLKDKSKVSEYMECGKKEEVEIVEDKSLNDPVYNKVDQMPRFGQGCDYTDMSDEDAQNCSKTQLLTYIYKNLTYPEEARKNGIEGMNVVQMAITKEGKLTDVKLLRNIGGRTDNAVLMMLDKMNADITWEPGIKDGKKVAVKYTLPIRFRLTGDQKSTTNKETVEKIEKNLEDAYKPSIFLEEIKLSPNPTRENLRIEFKGPAGPVDIRVFSIDGRLLYKETISDFSGSISKEISDPSFVNTSAIVTISQGGKIQAERVIFN